MDRDGVCSTHHLVGHVVAVSVAAGLGLAVDLPRLAGAGGVVGLPVADPLDHIIEALLQSEWVLFCLGEPKDPCF